MRDYKKCGLTFSRKVLKLIQEVLEEYSPLFKYLEAY